MLRNRIFQESDWSNKIDQWRQSGKSAKAWCLENQVVYPTFMAWRNRLKAKQKSDHLDDKNSFSPSKPFVELQDQAKKRSSLTLECNGVQILISEDFDTELLCKCLITIRNLSC